MRPRLGFSEGNDYYNTGKMGTNWGTGIPMEVTPALLQRGEQRFNINCAVCHGPLAAGDGIVKQYGLATVVGFQDDRRRQTPAWRRARPTPIATRSLSSP